MFSVQPYLSRMTIQLAITLDAEQKTRLDAIAEARDETAADVVNEAVTRYLDYDAWFRARVQEGLDSLARGEGHDLEEVEEGFRQHIAALKRAEADR